MTKTNNILKEGYYLTDGGLETTLIFEYGIDLPHFASFDLFRHAEGREAIARYYKPYLQLAHDQNQNFILDVPTWRANKDWGFKLGYTEDELKQINIKAVEFIRNLKGDFPANGNHIILGGQIGPRGDGYSSEDNMTVEEAKKYHIKQIETLAEAGVEMLTALTMNYSEEGAGVALAAKEAGIPLAISYTVETNGILPSGEALQDVIELTDQLTGNYPGYYMINCAHPEHFKHVLQSESEWKQRIGGIRANASTKSHAELDACESLDAGDQCQLAEDYKNLMNVLPNLKVFGGCCGTDYTHLNEICRALSTN